MNSFVTLIESGTGKFEKLLLDLYRHSWLNNQLVTQEMGIAGSNNNMRNLIQTFDLLISALQAAQAVTSYASNVVGNLSQGNLAAAASSFGSATNVVKQQLQNQVSQQVTLPAAPNLAINKPPPSATISDIITNPLGYGGITVSGTPLIKAPLSLIH